MALDINKSVIDVYGTDMRLATGVVTLDGSNRVRPYAPTTLGGQAVGTGAATNQYPWVANQIDNNGNGNSWNNNNSFTALVTGLYRASLSIIFDEGGPNNSDAGATRAGYAGFVVNGVLQSFTHANNCNGWDTMHICDVLLLNQSDALTFFVNIAPYPAGNSLGGYRNNHNSMSICLLG